jgi:CO/xanthine dehydrogenase FAD-binding subunit
MLPRFRCLFPRSKEEALRLLKDEPNAKILAGGTDLLVDIRKYACCPETLLDITRVKDLQWGYDKTSHCLSPISTHAFVAHSSEIKARFEALSIASGYVGSPQIRNMSTLGGNIANGCPAADSIPPFLIYDAAVRLESFSGERTVPVEGLVLGPYRTAIKADELMTSINLKPLEGYRVGLKRLSIRAALAISRLSVAWAVRKKKGAFEDVRIAIGSCTPVPFRARESEAFLREKGDKSGGVDQAVDAIINGIREATGERPTHAFKLPILKNILFEVLKD